MGGNDAEEGERRAMPYRSDPDYVAGTKPPYRIQLWIVHPAFCVCDKCIDLPLEIRSQERKIRMNRASKFPDSRKQTAVYAIDVKRLLEQQLRDAVKAAGSRPISYRMSLREIFNLMFSMNPRKVSAETIKRDEISAKNLCRLLGDLAPDEIDEPALIRYRNAREKEGAATRTIWDELSTLRKVLVFGVAWQRETGMQGMRFSELPYVGDMIHQKVTLTYEEFRAFLEPLSPINRRRAIFGATTLLRRHPLLALQRSWVDARERWLSVPKEYMKKGRARSRLPLEVPLSRWALAQLADLHGLSPYYWPNTVTGEPLTWVDHIFADASRKSGLKDKDGAPLRISCQTLRRSGITWLREEGVDELRVAILAGQRSTFDPDRQVTHLKGATVTQQYTKVFATALREAVDVQDEIRRKVERPALRAVT